ncbi:MAG TPA: 3-methyl-2-oxobutanoate hydroxymethyltransferase [Candidatus Binataceae bacterium]|nr:3-methyl-2-oxobutanoate hydroxymethyltransferase [Candidatus Binataceae bacterium]
MLEEKVRVPDLARMKSARRPIAMLTAYDYPFARIFDLAGLDVLLVGDSVAMAVRGEESTLAVTIDEMIYHTRAVARARKRALLVADMPFLSYQVTPEDALRNAGRLLKEAGAEAVKLEGGAAIAETVRRLTAVDIPVMGHIGLTPQSVHRMGGHRVQGRKSGDGPGCRERLVEDALAIEAAGAFAIVVEGVPASLGREIAARVRIPAIGIGAGPDLDGQVLVMHDMLGLGEAFIPRFAKPFATLRRDAAAATESYVREVRERAFPAPEHCYAEAAARQPEK